METNYPCIAVDPADENYDVFRATCPTRQALGLIGDKWSVLVVLLLAKGPRRFGELRRQTEGVSQKMLTQTLRGLERSGLVARRVYATTPPSVEYSLTPLGQTLTEPMEELTNWAARNITQVLDAQAQYDARDERELVAD